MMMMMMMMMLKAHLCINAIHSIWQETSVRTGRVYSHEIQMLNTRNVYNFSSVTVSGLCSVWKVDFLSQGWVQRWDLFPGTKVHSSSMRLEVVGDCLGHSCQYSCKVDVVCRWQGFPQLITECTDEPWTLHYVTPRKMSYDKQIDSWYQ